MQLYQQNDVFYAVPGADINASELKLFEHGDKILIELNGSDNNPGKFGNADSIASNSWVVKYNTATECIIKNQLNDIELILDHQHLINESPAVFEQMVEFSTGLQKATIIPKLAAYHLPLNNVVPYFVKYNNVNQISKIRNSPSNIKAATIIVFGFIKNLNKFGWDFNSINRFSLRSGVELNTIYYIHNNTIDRIFKDNIIDYIDLSKIYKASLMYASFWKEQAMETGVDEEKIIQIPRWNERS